ncbi:Tyrosine-protein kinase receptor torso [Strongyloides ratti]|uniref:receptor protein-tyrosine kinase n=1 Tax=Strongyloides ratti TaxID=34506 RepID=A0A090KXG2_STRRB|nr:Tyrosine-protein kinase receptor torso [Strongyloides ratti]CEF62106.1 Tyrosine-protein kinase receptor torso [Strongyloides ratti]
MITSKFVKLSFLYLGILISLITLTKCDQYCLTSIKFYDDDAINSNITTCTQESLDESRNTIINKTKKSFGYQANICDRTYVLDLGSEFTSPDDFDNLKVFIYQSLIECLDRNIGHSIFVSVFNNSESSKKCCGKAGCLHAINELPYDNAVKPFFNKNLIWNETNFSINYSREFLNQLKKFEQQYCSKNSVVFITNRIVKLEPDNIIFSNIQQVLNYYCSSLTILLVGRKESTYEILKNYYGNISKDIYNIPDLSCTEKVVECIVPCHDMLYDKCSSQNFTSCNRSDHLPTVATRPTIIPDPNPQIPHIIYVYGISTNMSHKKFNKMQETINSSIYECFNIDSTKISVMFINYDIDVTTDWLDTPDNILNSLNLETFNDVSLTINYPYDETSSQITKMIKFAITTINNSEIKNSDKKIILLTDFVSLNFTNSINSISKNNLKDIIFQVYCFTEISYLYYKHNTSFANGDVFYLPFNNSANTFHLCSPKPSTTTTTEKIPSDVGSNIGIILIATLGTCAILFLILCGGTVLYRNRVKNIKLLEQNSDYNCDLTIEGADIYEIKWNNLFYSSEKIGNGAYGQVYKGTYMGIPLSVSKIWKSQPPSLLYKNSMPIAIKILPKTADEKARENFLHEIEVMKKIGYHDNIVGMVGCITKSQPNALIMEYCENKDLYRFIKNMKADLSINNNSMEKRLTCQLYLLTFCMQITSGMKYLVSKGIIHRDLAARNILIDGKNIIKIGDFGLCIEVNNNDTIKSLDGITIQRKNGIIAAQSYKTQKLPVKWLSPESLRSTIFTFSSDIWSFGMVMYEMYSFGGVPFHEIEPCDLLNHIIKGNRPQRPEFSSSEIYNIMERCWEENPENRPTFDELNSEFMVLLENTSDTGVYVELLTGSIYYKNVAPIIDNEIEEDQDNNILKLNKKPLKQSLSANAKIDTFSKSNNVLRSKTMLLPNFVKRLSRDFTVNHNQLHNISKKDSFFYDDNPRRKSESIISGTPTSPSFMDSINEFKKTLTNSTSKIFSKRD